MYIFWGIVIIIILWLMILYLRARRNLLKYQSAVETYIDNIFSGQMYRPEVKAEFSYGIPAFRLRFKTDEEKRHAESHGLTNSFLQSVQALCSNLRPRGNVFDAHRAVAIYSKDDERRWAQLAAHFQNRKRR